jgi:hypothetical protein
LSQNQQDNENILVQIEEELKEEDDDDTIPNIDYNQ